MNKRLQVIKYVASDFFTAFIAWTLFFIYRKYVVDHQIFSHLNDIFGDQMRLTVNLTVKMPLAERTSKWDNGLHMQLMIEWE